MSDIKFRATPVARFLSKQNNIDLSLLKGTGPKGRIQKEDVLNFKNFGIIKVSSLAKKIAEVEGVDLTEVTGTGVHGKILKEDILEFLANKDVISTENIIEEQQQFETQEVKKSYGEVEEVPMSMMRRTVAKRMSESYFTAPVFVANIEVDMTEVKNLRANIMQQLIDETGYKLTITDIISLATVKSLVKHPYVNCSLSADGTKILLHKYVNLAMAVGLENGLLTPVVKNAEKMSLRELMISLKDLTKKAVEMKLESEELEDSTFTISNLGMFGIDSFAPIINQPNSAILGVSATVDKLVVVNGEITVRPIMKLSITVDHRVVDGMEAAKFLNTLKNYLENPISILV